MRKTLRTLRLGKETLHRLSARDMQAAGIAGGIGAQPVGGISQDGGNSCVQSCYFNTCGAGCDWQTQAGLN